MADQSSPVDPDKVAVVTFWLTIIGVALFVGSIALFIL